MALIIAADHAAYNSPNSATITMLLCKDVSLMRRATGGSATAIGDLVSQLKPLRAEVS
jgi:hypothetical protein